MADEAEKPEEKIFSVRQLCVSVARTFQEKNILLRNCWISGEISGWKRAASGHCYFTLKDEFATISCALFAGAYAKTPETFRERTASAPGDGIKVEVRAEIEFQRTRGQCQLIIHELRIAGEGDLAAKFAALKAKLGAEGLFDDAKKRPLPFLPRRIGIVTSPTGAVIHDMCTVLVRRFPNVHIRLYPVKVQGEGAKEDIVRGIRYFDNLATAAGSDFRPDLLIVGRGGGSIEDLWAFNEEEVVRAVASARVPVISAVGHQTDFTLCDFAADRRAGTPSIAAEIAVPVKAELEACVADCADRLGRSLVAAKHAADQRVDFLHERMASRLRGAADAARLRCTRLGDRLVPAVKAAFADAGARLRVETERLRLLGPDSVLARGYSIVTGADGKVVRSASSLAEGDALNTRFADGSVVSIVKKG